MSDVFRAVVIADSIARCYGGALDDARLHIAAPDYASAKAIALAMVNGCVGTKATHHPYDEAGVERAAGVFLVTDNRKLTLAVVAYHGPAKSSAAECSPSTCLIFEDCRLNPAECSGPRTTPTGGAV